MDKKAVVVLPTYNEKDNIIKLLDAILLQQHRLSSYELHVLVVDDTSPDGTGTLVRSYIENHPNVHLLTGKKQGLGVAYIRGFKFAIDNLHADVVFEMDADFSHNPYDIPRLLTEIDLGSDFVIGSRYVSGGTIPDNWSYLRKLNSKFGNILARYIVGLTGIKDCTSGYRAIRTSLLKKINLRALNVKGYVFQVSLLHACLVKGAKITESPIKFIDRINGESKLRTKDIIEFITNAIQLRFPWLVTAIRFFLLGIVVYTTFILSRYLHFLPQHTFLDIFVSTISIFLTIQGLVTLLWMLYAWEDPKNAHKHKSPEVFVSPKHFFTALVPARHEEKVIRDTIQSINAIDYPAHLKEIIVLCREDDHKTILKAQEIIDLLKNPNIRLITFNSYPINKPHSLNIGYQEAKGDTVVVLDAEDEVSSDIYNVVNTVIENDQVDIVQGGVQLMNYRSYWFSAMNVVEYFFWFKSGLQFFTKFGQVTPLGGNTVFIKKQWLEKCKGWDENCLTEDADIGIRLTLLGAKTKVIYDEQHTTREETPSTLNQLIKQRTRWNQGFLNIVFKGDWTKFPKKRQKLVALYILLSPEMQAFFLFYLPFAIWIGLSHKIIFIVSFLSFLPLYIYLMQIFVYIIGLYLFTRLYKLKFPIFYPAKFFFIFFVYQLILSYAAFRAIYRTCLKENAWEKTLHVNNHRIINSKVVNRLGAEPAISYI